MIVEKGGTLDVEGTLNHAVGNMMNEIIFSCSYDQEDKVWQRIQDDRAKGDG